MVTSSIRVKYPNCYNLHIKASFYKTPFFCGVLLLMTHLLYTHLFSDMHKETKMYKNIRHVCPYATGTPFTYGTKPGAGKRETQHRKEQIWNDSSPDNCLKYRVLSSFLRFLTWRGGKVKETLLQGFSSSHCQSQECNMNLLHLGSKVNYLLDLKVG